MSLRRISRATRLEVWKLWRQRLTWCVVGAPTLGAALIPQGLCLSGREGLQGYLALTTALGLSLLLACFLVLLQASTGLAWEKSDRTLRNYLVAPLQRSEIFLSRWISLELELLLLLGLVVLAGTLSTGSRLSFEDIRGEAIEPLFYASELREHTARAILYFVPAGVALVTVGLLASVLCSTPAAASALALGALVSLDVAKSLVPGSSSWSWWLFNSYLPTLFDQSSYLRGVSEMARGIGDVLWAENGPQHSQIWITCGVTTAASLLLAMLLFQRKASAE